MLRVATAVCQMEAAAWQRRWQRPGSADGNAGLAGQSWTKNRIRPRHHVPWLSAAISRCSQIYAQRSPYRQQPDKMLYIWHHAAAASGWALVC